MLPRYYLSYYLDITSILPGYYLGIDEWNSHPVVAEDGGESLPDVHQFPHHGSWVGQSQCVSVSMCQCVSVSVSPIHCLGIMSSCSATLRMSLAQFSGRNHLLAVTYQY